MLHHPSPESLEKRVSGTLCDDISHPSSLRAFECLFQPLRSHVGRGAGIEKLCSRADEILVVFDVTALALHGALSWVEDLNIRIRAIVRRVVERADRNFDRTPIAVGINDEKLPLRACSVIRW